MNADRNAVIESLGGRDAVVSHGPRGACRCAGAVSVRTGLTSQVRSKEEAGVSDGRRPP